jgi:hypothetical protein
VALETRGAAAFEPIEHLFRRQVLAPIEHDAGDRDALRCGGDPVLHQQLGRKTLIQCVHLVSVG